MKATLGIPDAVFRKAKAAAAEQGVSLRQFVTKAIEARLTIPYEEKPWMKMAGGLRHLHNETVRIQKIIDDEFGHIDPREWRRL